MHKGRSPALSSLSFACQRLSKVPTSGIVQCFAAAPRPVRVFGAALGGDEQAKSVLLAALGALDVTLVTLEE